MPWIKIGKSYYRHGRRYSLKQVRAIEARKHGRRRRKKK